VAFERHVLPIYRSHKSDKTSRKYATGTHRLSVPTWKGVPKDLLSQ
jgi:hypothetical protein